MKKPPSIARLGNWIDSHLLEIISGFLLAFIPLYPKWPLFDILPGYIVRVRLEDFVVALSVVTLIIQLLRQKASFRHSLLPKLIFLYWAIGLLSALSSIFITHTVPLEIAHVGKLFLHWFRRIEYMSLAFIFLAAIKSTASIKRILTIFLITTVLIGLYGFGQKYLQWPVYSTMNREFAKGWRLILTENARVSSTFAGHYDLAAFTVIATSVIATVIIFTKNKLRSAGLWIAYLIMFATLLLTASRTSFIAYLAAITGLCFLLLFKLGLKKIFLPWLLFMVISFIGFFSFGTLASRFAHFRVIERFDVTISNLADRLRPPYKPSHYLDISNDLQLVYTQTDTPPSPVQTPSTDLPPDVYEAIPQNFPEASLSAIPATSGTGSEGKPRDYSTSAYQYGLSGAIRFDALWPRALAGFKSNPLLGSGYSTLTKDQVTDFTEAESTDNDYLRALGETGLLGLLSFFGIIIISLIKATKSLFSTSDPTLSIILAASISLLFGMLINAIYIDIFEASKVAYIIWAFIGLIFASTSLTKPSRPHAKN